MTISPGLDFIGRSLAHLLFPCIVAYGMLTVICDLLALTAPSWVLVFLSLVPRLLYFLLKPFLNDRNNSRDAKAHGAVLPPHIGVNSVEASKQFIENFKSGYPGQRKSYDPCLDDETHFTKPAFSSNGARSSAKHIGSPLA